MDATKRGYWIFDEFGPGSRFFNTLLPLAEPSSEERREERFLALYEKFKLGERLSAYEKRDLFYLDLPLSVLLILKRDEDRTISINAIERIEAGHFSSHEMLDAELVASEWPPGRTQG